jgi:hypothetical protein
MLYLLLDGRFVPGSSFLATGVPCYWRFVLVPGRCASRSSWPLDFWQSRQSSAAYVACLRVVAGCFKGVS